MEKKVVCSDCGAKFVVTEKTKFSPANCPGCGAKIMSVTRTTTSEDYVAWVEE